MNCRVRRKHCFLDEHLMIHRRVCTNRQESGALAADNAIAEKTELDGKIKKWTELEENYFLAFAHLGCKL